LGEALEQRAPDVEEIHMSWSRQADEHDREALEYREAATHLPRDSATVQTFLEAAEEHETNAAFLRMTEGDYSDDEDDYVDDDEDTDTSSSGLCL
jgi:hypothetical protein